MNPLVLAWLMTPGTLSSWQRMVLLVPLCLSISIVYKTLRTPNLRDVPVAAGVLCVTIVAAMYAVGVGVWLLFLILS